MDSKTKNWTFEGCKVQNNTIEKVGSVNYNSYFCNGKNDNY